MRGNSRNRDRENRGQIARMDMQDPFTQMRQMMRGFGGFGDDDFMGGMMNPFGRDPFEDMFSFSDMHKNVHERGKEGSYVCQTFVSSSKMGSDGKMHREDYFENNMGEHRGGNTISQKQQAYKNNRGVNRIAEERMLNDRGRKVVKEKRGNDIEETNHYYNIDDEEAGQFDNDWRNADKNMKFLENHQRYMRGISNGQQAPQLEYEPYRQPQRESRSTKPQITFNKRSSQRP